MGFFMNFLAFDLGGSSGKLILGSYESGKLSLTTVHQFENQPVLIDGRMYWDFLYIYKELCRGIKKAVRITEDSITSIGFDSFCNDFALVAQDGTALMSNPLLSRSPYGKHTAPHIQHYVSKRALPDQWQSECSV